MTKKGDGAQQQPRKRVVLLTQWFDPEPTPKGMVFARALAGFGFEVEVVTGFPNYPSGKVYPGFRIRPIKREVVDGIRVTRLALYPSHDRSGFRRAMNYGSFFLSSVTYLLFARRADVLYAYHPPLTVGMTAATVRTIRRWPTVLDIQDMWPDTLRASGMLTNPRLLRVIGRICRSVYRRVDHIVVLSPGFRRLLLERGVPPAKVSIIPNWTDEQAVVRADGPPGLRADGTFKVLFAGNMGLAQGLGNVLDAAALLQKAAPNVEFAFLGSGIEAEHLKKRVAAEGLANVRFYPQVPMGNVGRFLAAADCLLVHLRADPLFAITIPSKTQAYLAAGKPIIMAVQGDAAAIILQAGAGLVVPQENPRALADAILQLSQLPQQELIAMGQRGRDFYQARMSLESGTAAFATLFRQIAQLRRRSGRKVSQ